MSAAPAAGPFVRRVRADEGERVRELRLQALRDRDAAIAFLDTAENAARHPSAFWADRAGGASTGTAAAQFVAEDDAGRWVGTATVLRRAAGDVDHLGRSLDAARSDVVGVYVTPEARGAGLIDALLTACADWARSLGDDALFLDVHSDNARAEAAYVRNGFVRTGLEMTGPIGPERELRRPL